MIFARLPNKSQNVHAVFESPRIFVRVYCAPVEPFANVFFWAGNCGILQDPNTPKNTKTQISGEKRRKKRQRFGRGILNTCGVQKIRVYISSLLANRMLTYRVRGHNKHANQENKTYEKKIKKRNKKQKQKEF